MKMHKDTPHPLEVSARLLAEIFEFILSGEFFQATPRLVDKEIQRSGLSGARAARVLDVVLGVLRWRDRLDTALDGVSKRGRLKVPDLVHCLLRALAYELIVRRKDEPAGLVSEVVSISKRFSSKAKSGDFSALTNAIGRKLALLPEERAPDASAGINELASYYSIPLDLLEKMNRDYGEEFAGRVARATGDRFIHQLRVNPFKEKNEEYPESLGATKRMYEGFEYWETDSLTPEVREANREGRIIVQALPSLLASLVLDPRPGESVLDAASGVGVKAHHLTSLIGSRGEIVLADISPNKKMLSASNFERWGVPEADYRIVNIADREAFKAEFKDCEFDAIMVDVPCTGSGLIHHYPEKRYTLNPAKAEEFARREEKILENCLSLLKPGGRLVYATCSIWKAENEEVTASVLSRSRGKFASLLSHFFSPSGKHPGFFIEKIKRIQ